MQGLYIKQRSEENIFRFRKYELSLDFRQENLEIITQKLDPDSLIWIAPAQDPNYIEFYYIVSGSLCINTSDGEHTLQAGDSFFTEDLKQEIKITAQQETTLLCVVNSPVFDDMISFSVSLDDLQTKINEKDNYTHQHGKNVMHYSVKIMEEMGGDKIRLDNIGVAALFHDIGKYYVPAEILQKNGGLTSREAHYIMRHPIDSKRLLQKKFGSAVAEIAEAHHERLDGSGYPYSLQGDEIALESRIIGVADAFDAMTTQRSYNTPKSYIKAIDELLTMPHLYDETVLLAFKKLIVENKIGDQDEN